MKLQVNKEEMQKGNHLGTVSKSIIHPFYVSKHCFDWGKFVNPDLMPLKRHLIRVYAICHLTSTSNKMDKYGKELRCPNIQGRYCTHIGLDKSIR